MAGISPVSFTGIKYTAYKTDSDGKEVKVPINLDGKYASLSVKDQNPDEPDGRKKILYVNDELPAKSLENYDRVEIDRIDEVSHIYLSCSDEIPIKTMADHANIMQAKDARSQIGEINGKNIYMTLIDNAKTFIKGKATMNLHTPKISTIDGSRVKVTGENMKLSA